MPLAGWASSRWRRRLSKRVPTRVTAVLMPWCVRGAPGHLPHTPRGMDTIEGQRYDCGHVVIQAGCGGCDPGAVVFVMDDRGRIEKFCPEAHLVPGWNKGHRG